MQQQSWPRCHSLPYYADASHYFEPIHTRTWPVWLDSGQPAITQGRYDILAADPIQKISLTADQANQLPSLLRSALRPDLHCPDKIPFCGGWIGYLSYELGRAWMGFPLTQDTRLAPDARIGLYDWAIIVDHHDQTAHLVSAGLAPETRTQWAALCEQAQPKKTLTPVMPSTGLLLDTSLTTTAYAEAFQHIQDYLHAGESYQINLTRRFRARSTEPAWSLYRRLRTHSPAPYGAYLGYPDITLCSNSPEQFVQKTGAQVSTRPIKGTRPRGQTTADDLDLQNALQHSSKDRAENLMIVDLLRNDLSRVCRPGSVQVPDLFRLATYATVHHLVSTIQGELATDQDAVDLLQACFPGGSITGAPKKRAMQIIDELEPVSRELYCGSLFWLGVDGNMDSNICIRTLLKQQDQLYYWAGGGIVADSISTAEYQESLDKAAAFMALIT